MFNKLLCYPGQPDEEITQFVVFQTIFAIGPFLFAEFVVGFVGLAAIYFGSSGQTISNVGFSSGFYTLIGFAIIALSFFFLLATLWVWRHNRLVVTNEHLVDVDQIGLFANKLATLSLGVIQDVSSTVSGPTQTVLHYGTLIVQTAGERENFTFAYTPDPHTIEQKILDVHEKFLNNNKRRDDGLGAEASQAKDETLKNPLENP